MKKQINLRAVAAQAIEQVVEHGQSLSQILPPLQHKVGDKDKALLQELCFGALRVLPQLEWLINKLMARPMTGKQRTVHYLIMVGLYQLLHTRIPPHAALAETVEGTVAIKRSQFKGLVNGVLRQFQRQQETLLTAFAQSEERYLHPQWLIQRIKKAWPQQWEAIIDANNQRPPMWLRVNRNHHSRDAWLTLLQEAGFTGYTDNQYPDAIRMAAPVPVHALPGFELGWVTVQDASAQGCISRLEPQNGENILDLCAAPGGKTTHILEAAPLANVTAVDIDQQRLARVHENLKRLGMSAKVIQGDGRSPSQWCGSEAFDRILLDAPCSATGVIRRHPDIKWLRRDRDIPELVRLQSEILDAIWPHLKPGGTLVYATCSILPEENSLQIANFLKRTPDAKISALDTGEQNFPGAEKGDGFFYATLVKQ
ncbi:16S rRNA (cytosine(967)-C(5))-methyltransferase RsmB [Apirhabdus apintestini]|uniref:16S rRNA (cytosine(967)-C(5))-methyltransferase RsmB n=1 Tax=Erwinia sp. HR93 TaxID=3094840 RepID=UPI002ADEC7C4|nr:16S rRNA (cytosine(967)-C(5))-methyltransferase RsmB [Erwinia sp. HR93]MEA1063183.1 16S rRNA (cytosine(967)-C(5))-methyltransferase RsmB [Erwinia sp. HR93]WPM84617.1 16S rRNA (cytosine(967)-C(5))-methyltransferase RsmB [Enterobacteriaceae bacterium CA-0114]